MSRTTRELSCTPEAVFRVLADGWSYATWVVGAARIRSVDDGFPAAGTSVHHSVGAWPALLSDRTTVESVEPPRALELTIRFWPAGQGRVQLSVRPLGQGCEVTMVEEVTAGPARLLPRPVQDLLLHPRNVETLKRLAYLAEGRG